MWQHSAPSNLTTPTHQHNSQDEDFPSDPPDLMAEETLESQVEYLQEEVEEEEVEEVEGAEEEAFLLQYQPNKLPPMGETNSSATHHSYSQGTAPNQKNSWPTGRSIVEQTKTPPE